MSYCYLASYLDYLSVLRDELTHVNDDAFGLTKESFNNYVDKKRGVGGLRDKGI